MLGFLWDYAAVHGNRPEWIAPAAKWQKIRPYGLFKQHDALNEFNSPTYGGVDLYALALWRDYGLTPAMRSRGREMEAALWRTTADFYNANLRNISGPYDRSYGMDMRSYVSIQGLWLRTVLDAEPRSTAPVGQASRRPRTGSLVCAAHCGARHAHSAGCHGQVQILPRPASRNPSD